MISANLFEAARNRYRRLQARRSWDRRWRRPSYQPPWLADSPRPFVRTGFERGWLAPGMTVLEIGCGLGATAAWLARRGLQVLAIDLSSGVIEKAERNFPNEPHLTFACVDACVPTTFPTTFDVILDTGCLQHIPVSLRKGYRENLLTWSRAGTRFVVTMHKRDRTASDRLAEVVALFCPRFELVDSEEVPPANTEVFSHLNSVFHFVREPAVERAASGES